MNINEIGIDHISNVVRREIEEEFKDLEFFIVLHRDNDRDTTIERQKSLLLDKPGGKQALELLDRKRKSNVSEFLGLCIEKPKGPLKFLATPRFTGVICVNYERYISEENAMHFLYHMAWHALYNLQKFKNSEIEEDEDGIILDKDNRLSLTRKNLMADVFGAVMVTRQGSSDYIEKHAQKRSLESLSNVKHHSPEYFPYPIAYDACALINNDMKDTLAETKRPVALAMEMAEEVSLTYDDKAVAKWWSFAAAAQELAWIGTPAEDILGLALYSCEDAYLRTIAHQICENMNYQPSILTNAKTYNPFATAAVNQKLHQNAYEVLFKNTIAQVTLDPDSKAFHDAIHRLNMDLLRGNFTGWCGHALLKASNAYISGEYAHDPEYAAKVFYEHATDLSWETLHDLSRIIIKIRRQNNDINIERLIQTMQKAERFKPVAEVLALSKNSKDHVFNASAQGMGVMRDKIKAIDSLTQGPKFESRTATAQDKTEEVPHQKSAQAE